MAFPTAKPKGSRTCSPRSDTAEEPSDVGLFPGWRLHPLKGDLKGLWSVTITGNWRIVFSFRKGDAFDVDLTDYH